MRFSRASPRVACAVPVAPVEERAPSVASNTMTTQDGEQRQEGQHKNGRRRHILPPRLRKVDNFSNSPSSW